jgi:phosphatidylserine/phosphatidylglycerophosphate/cardiolipin synthase-like enzyme
MLQFSPDHKGVAMMRRMKPLRLHSGGPDHPPRSLSLLLQRMVAESRAGDHICWVTYYFRDRVLARALMDAADRGVQVSLLVDGSPRREQANAGVLAMLEAHGLGGGLSVHRKPKWGRKLHPHLHAKLYLFAGQQPVALIGSFNPSGDEPEEDPEVIAEIGDQDRGHNMLVEIGDPALVAALEQQAQLWRRHSTNPLLRFHALQNRVLQSEGLGLWLYPRLRTSIVEPELAKLGKGDRISGALSHVKPGPFTRALGAAAARGVDVNLIVHDTERRVPEAMLKQLAGQSIRVRRYRHAGGLPVHAKYLLLQSAAWQCGYFGSFNFNTRSRLLNIEILARSTDPALLTGLRARFNALEHEAQMQQHPPT